MDLQLRLAKILIFFLIPKLIVGRDLFDPRKPWPKDGQLPIGCYKSGSDVDVICFRVGDHPTLYFSDGVQQCEEDGGGRLAFTLTTNIWNEIVNDILKPNTTRIGITDYLRLGVKIPAQSTRLIGVHGEAVDLTAKSVWANIQPTQRPDEHIAYADMYTGHIYANGYFTNYELFYLCEYKVTLQCSADTLRDQLPNASFIYRESNKCYKFQKKIQQKAMLDIKCNEGFVLIGSPNTTCNMGKWSKLPRCVPGCPLPEPRKNTKLGYFSTNKTLSEYGERVLFICDEGHVTATGRTKEYFTETCTGNGQWTGSNDGCVAQRQVPVFGIEIREKYQPLLLTCPLWQPEWKSEDIIWFKNDEKLATLNETSWIKENGSLFISKVHSEDVGFYHCLHVTQKMKLSPERPDQLYKVAFRTPCTRKSIPSVTEKFYSEGEVITLSCGQTISPEQHAFSWYRNGELLSSNEIYVASPTGSLYFGKSHFAHSGNYTCRAVHKVTDCELNVTHKIIVTPKISNLCNSSKELMENYYSNSLLTQPWMARIWFNENILPWCYGTIIDSKWIITTADCLEKFEHVKSSNIFRVEIGLDRYSVELIRIHPRYERDQPQNNVALVKISELHFSNLILPACIVENAMTEGDTHSHCRNESELDSVATISGWGSLDVDDVKELVFSTENVKIEFSKKCLETCADKFTEGMFCATGTGNDTFAGGSGSPLVVQSKGKVNLIGIYTWGLRGMKKGKFDFFTNVTFHRNWIQRVISADE